MGEIIHTYISTGSKADNNIVILFHLLNDLSGWVFGDKGYLLNDEKKAFIEHNGQIEWFVKKRSNSKKKQNDTMPLEAKKMSKKRGVIENVIGIEKSVFDLEHTRHRKSINALTHLFAAMCAYSFYQRKPKVTIDMPRLLVQKNILKLAA